MSMFKFDEKCDIYCFGVMLGVSVIGKLPFNEISLVKYIYEKCDDFKKFQG